MLGFNFESYLIAICSGFLFLVVFLIYHRQTSKVPINHLVYCNRFCAMSCLVSCFVQRKVVPVDLASQVGEKPGL